MTEISVLVDSLYSKLLLRDFFAKIIPGALVILSVAYAFYSYDEVSYYFRNISFWIWVPLIGASWVTAFSIQWFGEFSGLIKYYNKGKYKNLGDYYADLVRFGRAAKEHELQRLERIVVIKEACGNGYLSLLFIYILIFFDYFVDGGSIFTAWSFFCNAWHVLVALAALTFFLAKMHFVHIYRFKSYMRALINAHQPSK